MAGANNAQMKSAGWKARDITKARAEYGRLSHDVMSQGGFSPRKGYEPTSRAKAQPEPQRNPAAGWQAAARGEGRDQRQAVNAARADVVKRAALDDYRRRAEGYARAGDAGKAALRGQIRDQIKRTQAAEVAASRSEDGPDYVRAKNERAKLETLLRSRDAIARGRKQASAPGQGDLFGTPTPQRGPSPFERRVTERRAMLDAAGERAKGRQGGLRDLAGTMMARRRAAAAAATPKPRTFNDSMNAFKSHAQGLIDKQYARSPTIPKLEMQDTGKYIRVMKNDGASRSAYAFIDKATGDVLKPDGWKRPAKGARGNIHTGKFGVTAYGAEYANRRKG